ncbi:MAG: TonB-dependent receptor, partial [Sphingomonadaceae bacterium]|nr:TonB-dependent receptor [Sphingomonadaceae bacterium]
QEFRRSDARSASPTSQGVTLRGLGGNAASRALVLLDGVPQGDPFAGYLNWPIYLPERIGRVRVTRGGGSGVEGSGALSGTIEFESVGVRDAPGFGGAAAVGSRDAYEARVLASARPGGGFALISGGYARGDGFVPTVPEQQGPADRGARYAQGSLALRAVVPAGSGELQAAMVLFDDERTRGTDFSANSTTGGDASLRYVAARFTALGYVQLRKFASQFASVDIARSAATQTLDQYNTPATGIGARFEARPAVPGIELRLGGEWRRASGVSNEKFSYVAGAPTRIRQAGGSSDIFGGFVEATRAMGALTLTGGGRVDRWRLTGGHLEERRITGAPLTSTVFPDRGGWEATGRIGAAWTAAPGFDLHAADYVGWRLPTLNELYRPFRVGNETTSANAALKPEGSRGIEAGAAWRPARGVRIAATAFANRLSHAIVNVTLSSTPTAVLRERRNLDALDAKGIEVDASLRRGDWRGVLSWTLTDARVRASGEAAQLDGLCPAEVPRESASATLGWRGLSLTARYTGAQFDDDQNTRLLGDALTFDAVARLPLGRGVTLALRGENIGNARVEAARSATGVVERASPRTLWVELRSGR